MQDVAVRAGVSTKTVSRVVNKEPRVNPETRKKIQKIIDELNFEPNQSAQSLAASRSLLLGLVYDNPSHAYITGLQDGVLKACNHFGYGLVIHPCDHEDPDLVKHLRRLVARTRMDGLILTPPLTENNQLLKFLEENKTPFTLISPLEQSESKPHVGTNDVEAARQVTQYLIEQGHRRIGFILGVRQRSGSEMRFEGYQQALRDSGIEFDDALVAQGKFTFESGEAAAQQLLRLADPPSAIFASNDYMAAGVLKAASQLRIAVPYELSVCGFDDSPIATYLTPTLTTVRHPVSLLAERGAEQLIKRLKKIDEVSDESEIRSEFIVRASSGPLANAKES